MACCGVPVELATRAEPEQPKGAPCAAHQMSRKTTPSRTPLQQGDAHPIAGGPLATRAEMAAQPKPCGADGGPRRRGHAAGDEAAGPP